MRMMVRRQGSEALGCCVGLGCEIRLNGASGVGGGLMCCLMFKDQCRSLSEARNIYSATVFPPPPFRPRNQYRWC